MKSLALAVPLALFAAACSSRQPMPTVNKLDLPRFMGKWYVIANIPTFIEKGAHNATETYALNSNGNIDTTFTFRADAFDGKEKIYHPTGFIVNRESNAEWRMQFLWPFKSEFLVSYINEDYSQTIIARTDRDYVWIMARKPQISDGEFQRLTDFLKQNGYDVTALQRVPQRWP